MTGALIPDGADTVANVEITDAGSDFGKNNGGKTSTAAVA